MFFGGDFFYLLMSFLVFLWFWIVFCFCFFFNLNLKDSWGNIENGSKLSDGLEQFCLTGRSCSCKAPLSSKYFYNIRVLNLPRTLLYGHT